MNLYIEKEDASEPLDTICFTYNLHSLTQSFQLLC